jgi:hypothetical protein
MFLKQKAWEGFWRVFSLRNIFIALSALLLWNCLGTVWMWPIAWLATSVALYRWGPEKKDGGLTWTCFHTRSSLFMSAIVPVLLLPLWPLFVLLWVFDSAGTKHA